MTSAAAILCVVLWWAMATALLGVAMLGRRQTNDELGRGLASFGLGMAALVAAAGLPMTVGLVRWLAP